MKLLKYFLVAESIFLFSCNKSDSTLDNSGYSTPNQYAGYTLVWSDEFSGNAIDENNWSFEIGNNGWGNHELEYYTNKNASVSNGNLIIEARAESIGGSNYSSARMITKGKKSFK